MSENLRVQILREIKRLATAAGGKVPGKLTFLRQTGIKENEWSGVLWARWGDAIAEAGLTPNTLQERLSTDHVLTQLAEATRHFGHVPTNPEMRLHRRSNPNFPSHGAITNRFLSRDTLLTALEQFARQQDMDDVVNILDRSIRRTARVRAESKTVDGHVYLLKSGEHYKIGRSDELERRVKEVRVAMPAAVALVHSIRTDDPPGIEAYWHRRFAEKRANGEWFKLSVADVTAFKRRRYQ